MKRRHLFPLVAVAVLALSACAGDPSESAATAPNPGVEAGSESSGSSGSSGSESGSSGSSGSGTESTPATELPSGAEATVTIDGRVYEFTSDPARLGINIPTLGCRSTFGTAVTVSVSLIAVDGEHSTDGNLVITTGDAASEQSRTFDLRAGAFAAPGEEVAYLAGEALRYYSTDNLAPDDIEEEPITLTHDGMTVSGSQQVYNIAEGTANPGVGTVQVDARCVNF